MTKPTTPVIEHVQSPRNAGDMPCADAVGYADLDGRAPRITLFLAIDGGTVRKARFQTFGCGYSIACCSALTELGTGKSLEECGKITSETLSELLGGLPNHKRFCADLAVCALQNAITKYSEEN